MFVEGEPVRALCPLAHPGDKSSQVYLTDESLVVVRNRRSTKYRLADVKQVNLRNRRYLIPVITGGIVAPLAIAALISGIGDPWLLFLLMLAGIFLFYHGIQGGPALSVFTSVKDYDTFIPSVSASLRSFVSYVNWQLKSSDDHLYVFLPPDQLARARSLGAVPEGTPLFLHEGEIPRESRGHIHRMQAGNREIALRFHSAPRSESVSITLGKPVPLEFLLEK